MEVQRVKLGSQGLVVSKQGLGCMGMSAIYGPAKPEAEMIDLIHKAIDSGITFLDTADAYGPYTNELLVGKAIQGVRNKVQLATKFAFFISEDGNFGIRGDPAHVRAACEGSLKRLGVDCIDLYYQHRVDVSVPIEITVGELKELVEEGKVKYLGLSEASASDIRRAHAVHPITAVQIEWSLWSRDVEEEIIPTCRELGIGIVCYSPLGRGFFSGVTADGASENDFRKLDPRFQDENMKHNKVILEKLSLFAEKKGCSTGQLALAWLHCQGEDVVSIPGTTNLRNFQENITSLSIHLSKNEMAEVESIVSDVKGERYSDKFMSDTWKFASSIPLATYEATS